MEVHRVRHAAGWATSVLSALLIVAPAAIAQPADQSAPRDSHPLPQVQVIASKLDPRALNRAAAKFVESHAGVSPVIHQMGRWRADVCPHVTGLTPAASAFVSDHVEEVARSVGAPTGVGRKCAVNVEIVFTPEPQQLLNHIAKAYPALLGSSRSAGDTTFSRAIQSWYLTGTRSVAGFQPPADSNDATLLSQLMGPALMGSVANADPAYGGGFQPSGLTGSHFTKGLTSELLHVFIIVDIGKVAKRPLRSVADYIAMLTLTRMGSLDACSELPSIIDLLSSGCGARQKPAVLTDTDSAYLKALYSSDLEANLNIEQGDMRDRMVKVIAGH